jgi:hypothetical protein
VSELPTGGATGGKVCQPSSCTRVRESKSLIHELFPQSEFFFEPWLASCRHNLAGDLRAQLPYATPPSDHIPLGGVARLKASKTRRGEPAGPEYGLVPSFLPNIRELTRVEIPGGAYSDNHRSA